MKTWELFRFEVSYQARRPWIWLYFAVILLLTLQLTMEAYSGNAREGGYAFNSPYVIAAMTVVASALGLLAAAALAGDAAARDVQVRMHPLVYTAPVDVGAYLGGRFLAAFVLDALVVLMMLLPCRRLGRR